MKDNDIGIEKKNNYSIFSFLYDLFIFIFFILFVYGVYLYTTDYYTFNRYKELIINRNDITKTTIKKNDYYRDYNFMYVQNTDNFNPTNIQDLKNILYTFINSGQEDFIFYCTKEYDTCTKDMEDLIYDDEKNIISVIYEFSHPFNDYQSISVGTDKSTGYVKLHVNKEYTTEMIDKINEKVDELYPTLVYDWDTPYNNIKRVHDYLANNVHYDELRVAYNHGESEEESPYESDNAYGALIQNEAICGGYTSALSLFIEKMGLKNMRITSGPHIWNAVEIDGVWYHIDNTWDDGRYTNGKSFLQHKYFMIDTNQLLLLDTDSHTFDQSIYSELAQ